jgi:hypothetical protein
VHGDAAWVTVKTSPAAVIVPLRGELVVLAAATYATVPEPDPLLPLVSVSHDAPLAAVHAQLPPALTTKLPPAPAAGTDCAVEASE